MKADEFLINLLRLNGEAIGHVRLQREAYLLSRCGGQLDEVAFIYLDGGPFSTELADVAEMVRAERRFEVDGEQTRRAAAVDGLSPDDARKKLGEMGRVTDLVLELAAAIVFIREEEHYGNTAAIKELMIRKPLSTGKGRLEGAIDLLRALGLEGAERTAGP